MDMVADQAIVFDRAIRIQYHIVANDGFGIDNGSCHNANAAPEDYRRRNRCPPVNGAYYIESQVQNTIKSLAPRAIVSNTAHANEGGTHSIREKLRKKIVPAQDGGSGDLFSEQSGSQVDQTHDSDARHPGQDVHDYFCMPAGAYADNPDNGPGQYGRSSFVGGNDRFRLGRVRPNGSGLLGELLVLLRICNQG
jgi:hypothetical protein